MPRIDIARLRKDRGMSQSELAHLLQITQSFLSAIENGKSPLPPEKEARIMEIFGIADLSEYTIELTPAQPEAPAKSIADMSEGDLFNQLLSRFHEHAHKKDGAAEHHSHHDRIALLEERNDRLMERNDSLMQRNDRLAATCDKLRAEIDSLRAEIALLKEKLLESKA